MTAPSRPAPGQPDATVRVSSVGQRNGAAARVSSVRRRNGAAARASSVRGRQRAAARPWPDRGRGARVWPMRVGAVATGLCTAAVIGDWIGVGVGLCAAGAIWWAAFRWRSANRRGELRAASADLPIAVDLLATSLRAGAPVARAAEVVGAAIAGPVGRRLVRVGTALRLGARPAEAWAAVAGVPGADRLIRAAVRSAGSGAALAGALGRVADDLRSARAAQAEAGAQRLGVLVVLPLGLCFLPGFLLTGVVPVVVAVLGDVLRAR